MRLDLSDKIDVFVTVRVLVNNFQVTEQKSFSVEIVIFNMLLFRVVFECSHPNNECGIAIYFPNSTFYNTTSKFEMLKLSAIFNGDSN